MPFEVKLSQLKDRAVFETAVAEHISRMHAFAKEVGKPRPTSHPLVEACVKRVQKLNAPDEYVADYVVVDDTPPPPLQPAPLSLEDRKRQHQATLTQAENEAKWKILPQRRVRLAVAKIQIAMSIPEDKRTAEQNEDIASFTRVQKAWQQIELVSAQAEAELDDLTEDSIDSWQPPNFG